MTQQEDIKSLLTWSNAKHYIGYGVVLALLALFVRFYIDEKVGRIKAEGEQKVIEARDQAQRAASDHFDELIKGLKTPAQAAPLISGAIQQGSGQKNAIKAPISVRRDQLTPEVQKTLPDAPQGKPDDPLAILDPEQQVDLGKREVGCEKKEGELSTCELDKQNLKNEINDLKGGNKWQRVVKEAKCLGFLGAGAAVGSKLGGWKGAAIGGTAGEVSCKIFF